MYLYRNLSLDRHTQVRLIVLNQNNYICILSHDIKSTLTTGCSTLEQIRKPLNLKARIKKKSKTWQTQCQDFPLAHLSLK